MKKVMITGSEGFIGKHLQEALKDEYEIIKFDIKNYIFQDARDRKYTRNFILENKPDIIIHLAANPEIHTSFEYPQEDIILNVATTINLLDICREHKPELFILASTAQVYGETNEEGMDENTKIGPKSPYSIGKYAAENYCKFFNEKYGIPTMAFRFFNIYGDNQPQTVVVPNLIRKIKVLEGNTLKMYGSEGDSRDFIYIKDLCKAFKLAIEKKPIGEVINIGSGVETKISSLALLTAKLLGREIKLEYDENQEILKIVRMRANANKAYKLLGWKAETTLEQGVKNVMKSMS